MRCSAPSERRDTLTSAMAQNTDMDFLERKEGSQVLHVRGDSDSLMNSLFDSVLKKQESSMPLTVPLCMRKLPKSFFNPPQHGSKSSSISHSRNSSTDSTHTGPGFGAAGQGNHMRAHSSPATLQQTYAAAQQLQQHAHLKQQSYDFTDELGPLPHGWERACTSLGQTYFINHLTQTTTWEDPRKKVQQQQQQQQQQAQQQQQQQQQVQQAAQQQQQQSIFHQQQAPTPTSQPQTPVSSQQPQQHQQQEGGPLLPPPPPQSVPMQQVPVGPAGQPMGPLPDGWERAETDEGEVYFINHQTRTTSWFDPRIPEQLQRPAALQLQQAGMSPQALQQRQQTLRLQRLQVERERLKIRQRMIMKQHFPNNPLMGDNALQNRLAPDQSGRGVEDEMNRTREALLRHSLQDIQEAPGGGNPAGKSAALDAFLSSGSAAADYHSRQESADSGVGLNSNYSLPHTPEDLLSPMDDAMDGADDPAMAPMARDGGGGGGGGGSGGAIVDTPELPGLGADNMDSDDLVPTIQQLDSDGLMSNEFLNDVTSIINANRMGNSGHTWL